MKKGKIKTILEDHWNGFLKIYENKIRDKNNCNISPLHKTIHRYIHFSNPLI